LARSGQADNMDVAAYRAEFSELIAKDNEPTETTDPTLNNG